MSYCGVFLTKIFQDCCEACKIGLVIGSSGQQCSTDNFSLGSPWDDVIENCCADITSDSAETSKYILNTKNTSCS